jgi:hypothetical protein
VRCTSGIGGKAFVRCDALLESEGKHLRPFFNMACINGILVALCWSKHVDPDSWQTGIAVTLMSLSAFWRCKCSCCSFIVEEGHLSNQHSDVVPEMLRPPSGGNEI